LLRSHLYNVPRSFPHAYTNLVTLRQAACSRPIAILHLSSEAMRPRGTKARLKQTSSETFGSDQSKVVLQNWWHSKKKRNAATLVQGPHVNMCLCFMLDCKIRQNMPHYKRYETGEGAQGLSHHLLFLLLPAPLPLPPFCDPKPCLPLTCLKPALPSAPSRPREVWLCLVNCLNNSTKPSIPGASWALLLDSLQALEGGRGHSKCQAATPS